MSDLAKEWLRIRRDVVEPILTKATRTFIDSCASNRPTEKADAKVVDVAGPGIRLVVMLNSEMQKLTFSFDMTPRQFKVTSTNVDDQDSLLDERSALSEVTADLVQSHVDRFLASVTPG